MLHLLTIVILSPLIHITVGAMPKYQRFFVNTKLDLSIYFSFFF
uniref:Uncharacterized protein n=1 Tax=Ascaris lumbricoides TaxID=6252 RepID=A0A0M3HGB9_ASCLU